MATDTPKLWKRSILSAKAETTTGTAIAMLGADAAFNVFNPDLSQESPIEERSGQSNFSMLPPVPGEQGGAITFTTELFGSGTPATPPTWAATLLASCGFGLATATYSPQTGQAQTLSLGLNRDGRLKQLAGAQGDMTMKFVDGKTVKMDWKFQGKWVTAVDAALLTPTYPVIIPPRFMGATITIGGTGYRVSEMEIGLGNAITLRKDAQDATGYHAAFITNRKITIKIDPESGAFSAINWYTNRDGAVSAAINCVIGTVTGNQMTINAPVCYMTNPPKDKNSGDTLRDELLFLPVRSSALGDDEISIAFA